MTHTSGLRPDVDLGDAWTGYDRAIELAIEEVLTAAPGERFVYSDINFFLLGDIVRRVSGKPLDQFAQRADLRAARHASDTSFLPAPSLAARIAPTERCTPLRLAVRGAGRDARCCAASCTIRPRGAWPASPGTPACSARRTTSRDLRAHAAQRRHARTAYAILSPLAVDRMIAPSTPPASDDVRGLGWDIDSAFSSNRGETAADRIVRAHRLHRHVALDRSRHAHVRDLPVEPDSSRRQGGRHAAARARRRRLRRRRSPTCSPAMLRDDLAGTRLRSSRPAPARADAPPVLTGTRRAARRGLRDRCKGKRVGLITNHTGRSRDGATTIDLLHAAPRTCSSSRSSAPSTGSAASSTRRSRPRSDEKTGLPIHSLYGETRRPTDGDARRRRHARLRPPGHRRPLLHLHDDDGVRHGGGGEAEASASSCSTGRIRSTACQIEGPALDKAQLGFTGYFPAMPIRHGMTMGELARLFNAREQDRRRPDRRAAAELAPRRSGSTTRACRGSTRRRTCGT